MELGIDLGSNSIGWAVVNKAEKKVIKTGVRIFQEGVVNYGQGEREKSLNSQRRENRGIRKQFFRKKLRKKLLLKILSQHKMAPVSNDFLRLNDWKTIFSSPQFTEWSSLNPYELRAKAVSEKLSLIELGRILYNLAQRRGFLSNSRYGTDDSSVLFDESGKNEVKTGKVGIIATEKIMGNKTLGQALNEFYPSEGEPYTFTNHRIRNRYTKRSMYIEEFNRIWDYQSQHYKQLNEEFKDALGKIDNNSERNGILFYQRKLRSQKKLIGKCTFEPKKARCPISAVDYELFRAYQFVNTVEYNGKRLNEKEREHAINLMLSKESPKFSELRKKIDKQDDYFKFNYKDDEKMPGSYTISSLSSTKFFGREWFDKSLKEQEDIWHVLFSFDDINKLKTYAQIKWNFSEEKAIKISKWKSKEGYSNLSRKAICNILPFLKKGYLYHKAVILGGVKNALGQEWKELNNENKDQLCNEIIALIDNSVQGKILDTLKSFLIKKYKFSDKNLKKLYHHSLNVSPTEIIKKLPLGSDADRKIIALRNPVVVKGIFELRKLINALIDEYGSFEQINIELARDIKISKSKRLRIQNKNKELEEKNREAIDFIRAIPLKVSHEIF